MKDGGWAKIRQHTGPKFASRANARDWCAAKVPPGPPAVRAMRLLAERVVAPPPSDMVVSTNRVAPCAEALAPHLVALLSRAETAGWQRGEVVAAVAAWSKAVMPQS